MVSVHHEYQTTFCPLIDSDFVRGTEITKLSAWLYVATCIGYYNSSLSIFSSLVE